jgi:hypothetical protein
MDRMHGRVLALASTFAFFGIAVGISGVAFTVSTTIQPTGSTFGRATVGTLNGLASNRKRVSRFTLAEAGSIAQISAYVDGNGSGSGGSQMMRYVIHADDGGNPSTLLAATGSHTIMKRAKAAWVTLALPTPLAVTAGSYHPRDPHRLYRDSNGNPDVLVGTTASHTIVSGDAARWVALVVPDGDLAPGRLVSSRHLLRRDCAGRPVRARRSLRESEAERSVVRDHAE